MPDTFVKIASVTVGSGGASSIDFTSIPSTYTDLCIKFSGRTTASGAADEILVRLNGSTSSATSRILYGTGSAAGSAAQSQIPALATGAGATSSTFSNAEIYVPNYAGSNNKSVSIDAVNENNATGAFSYLTAGLWSNTTAVTSITLVSGGAGNFVQYSTATLYGIKNS